MHIQRHLLKDEQGEYFGDHFRIRRYDYEWFMGEDRIGVESNFTSESQAFIAGFIVADDKLIIIPSKKSPSIVRYESLMGRMRGDDSGKREIWDLIELITAQEETHAFVTSKHRDGHRGGVLTFSPIPPPDGLYKPGGVMPVVIDEDALELERQLEQMAANPFY